MEAHRGDAWNAGSFEWDGWHMLAQPGKVGVVNPNSSSVFQASATKEEGVLKDDASESTHFKAGRSFGTTSEGESAGNKSFPLQPGVNMEGATFANLLPDSDCPNLREGRTPCACTEEDAVLLQRLQGRKAEILNSLLPPVCQVASCPVDLSTLKEYHQRHRVCEDHAKASTVLLCDSVQRYCQQCGRFHLLEDFDEGKRSCRRKLAHHNNRRRRKKYDLKESNNKDSTDAEQSPSSSTPDMKQGTCEGGEDSKRAKKGSSTKKSRKTLVDETTKEVESKRRRGAGNKGVSAKEDEEKASTEVLSSSNSDFPTPASASTSNKAARDLELMQSESTPSTAQNVLLPSLPDFYSGVEPLQLHEGTGYSHGHLLDSSSIKTGDDLDAFLRQPIGPTWPVDDVSPSTDPPSALVSVNPLFESSQPPPGHELPELSLRSGTTPLLYNIFPHEQPPISMSPDLRVSSQLALTERSLMELLTETGHEDQAVRTNATVSGVNPPLQNQTAVNSLPPPVQQQWPRAPDPTYTPQNMTGRMSFKLYDWNPGDFPRRLRHQIMEWLSQMPSDLEGYIRPGCTVLTIKTAMPSSVWDELERNLEGRLQSLASGEGQGLFGRGRMLVQVKHQLAVVTNGVVRNVSRLHEMDGPRLFSVRPLAIESGKSTAVVIRGCNFSLPACRVLCSIGGQYVLQEAMDVADGEANCCSSKDSVVEGEESQFSDCEEEEERESYLDEAESTSSDFQRNMQDSFSFTFPGIDSAYQGSAHVEIEHGVGCSSHRPILIADKHICDEVNTLALEIEDAWKGDCDSSQREATFSDAGNNGKASQVRLRNETDVTNFLEDLGWVLSCSNRPKLEWLGLPMCGVDEEDYSLGNKCTSLERWRRVLSFAVHRGWNGVTSHLLQMLTVLDKEFLFSEKNEILHVGIDSDGFSLLHGAVGGGHVAIVESIVKFGKEEWSDRDREREREREGWWDATWQGPGGLSALHLAALRKDGENFVSLLINRQKEALSWTNGRDLFGRTPHDYAHSIGNSHLDLIVAKKLMEHASSQIPDSSLSLTSLSCRNNGGGQGKAVDSVEVQLTLPESGQKSACENEPFLSKSWNSSNRDSLKIRELDWEGGLRHVSYRLNDCHVAARREGRVGKSVLLTVIAVLVACVGLCVLVFHPHQIKILSMSFRRCLSAWGIGKPHLK